MAMGQDQREKALDSLRGCSPFRSANSALSAVYGCRGTGKLDHGYKADAESAGYVVYSYETPIAWVRQDGTRVMPSARYSQVTAQHKGIVREAWAGRVREI